MTSNIHPAYRPDIDGLRAIAVLSVIGFHAFPHWIRGGYVGVDIFFVISGFLISTIVFNGVARGTFSYADFYVRRIRRIFPALIVILGFCLLYSWRYTFASEHAKIGEHVAAGAAFVANIALWRESGYFDTASELKPLLHLWSLGVEEQYYILWPVLVAALYRRMHRLLLIVCIVLAASFAANIYLVRDHPSAAFFWPITRFWELMIGSLLAYRATANADALASTGSGAKEWHLDPRAREVLSLTGIALVACSVLFLGKQLSFPGWWALAPTLGTMFIIAAGPGAWINRRLLASKPFVFFGLISYALYLWHWPLLSFLKIESGEDPGRVRTLLAVGASIGLAWLTYKLVERPLRFGGSPRPVAVGLCLAMAAVGVAGFVIAQATAIDRPRDRYVHFFEDNTWPDYRYMTQHDLLSRFKIGCSFFDVQGQIRETIDESCYTPTSDRTVFIWGDSHAQHLNYGLEVALGKSVSVLQVVTASCSPALAPQAAAQAAVCAKSNEFALDKIAELDPDLVVIAQFTNHELTDWDQLAAALRERGAGNVVLVGPAPRWTSTLPRIVARHYWPDPPRRISRNLVQKSFHTDALLRARYGASTRLTYVSLIDDLCNADGCLAFVGPDLREDIITFDTGHFTAPGSVYAGENILAPVISRLMQSGAGRERIE